MRRMDGLIEGAMTTMLVFKRLTAVAVTICALMAGLDAVWAGDGKPSDWQMNFQQSATPVMDDIVRFHTGLLYTIIAIAGFVLVLLAHRDRALQRAQPIRPPRAPPTTPCSRWPGR